MTSAWSRTPSARAVLSRITASTLYVHHPKVVGPDTLELTFAGKEALDAIRTAFVERVVGMSFSDANAAGKAQDYLAADACHATVDDVLTGMFGDPNQWRGFGVEGAQARVRAGMLAERSAAA